jgi:hypothetical protein
MKRIVLSTISTASDAGGRVWPTLSKRSMDSVQSAYRHFCGISEDGKESIMPAKKIWPQSKGLVVHSLNEFGEKFTSR